MELLLALLLGLAVRAPFWAEALRTPVDGDMAIVGLMARHPGRSLTMWGQPYGSPLEAWLAAPLLLALGSTAGTLRLAYFLLGLALVVAAWWLARALDPDAALPAALLVACPPAYFMLLASMPPPMYPSALVLCALVLGLALRLGDRVSAGERPVGRMALWGLLAGVALWTHLMSASAVLAAGAFLFLRARRQPLLLAVALGTALLASAPWWARALTDRQAGRVVRVTGRERTMAEHLREVAPALPLPLGGVLGTHAPVVADDAEHVVYAPPWVAALLAFGYGLGSIMALRVSGTRAPSLVLLAAAVVALIVFPLPLRSSAHSIRFLTPLFVPLAAFVSWGAVRSGGRRGAAILVLVLAGAHLTTAGRLLRAWQAQDRARPPFLLPDLGPMRRALEERGIRRAYASYGPAYRLTFETGERIVASQPWNERFRHYPVPYLDEVRFAKNVAWVLTPAIPTDLPGPRAFEDALGAIGGSWQKTMAGPAVVYHSFTPPFSPRVEPLAAAGLAGDGDPATALRPAASETFSVDPPRALDALTLLCGTSGPALPRSLDVEVSGDGATFEVVARRRRREERQDLRWVNGHPQYVIDHDLIAVPLGGRLVSAVRLRLVESTEPWGLGELLLHPATPPAARPPWDEWLPPRLSWPERQAALSAEPLPAREDWYYRAVLVSRRMADPDAE